MISGGTGDFKDPSRSDEAPYPRRASSSNDAHVHDDGPSSGTDREDDVRGTRDRRTQRRRPALDAWRSALTHAIEAGGFVQTLLQVRADRARLSLRKTVTLVLVGVLAATAIVPLILGGVVLFVLGVTQSLAHAFGDREWLGNLLGGVLILGAIGAAAWIVQARIARHELVRKLARYDQLRRRREARADAAAKQAADAAAKKAEPVTDRG